MTHNIIGLAILGLVLIAALVLPASAAQVNGNGNAYGNAEKIDTGLKNDLWAVHAQYRLQVFDTHIEGANAVVKVLGDHGCSTTDVAATVASIGNERDALSTALDDRDRTALQTVNQDLVKLWKQFAEETRASVKACSVHPVTTGSEDTSAAAGL